jgi:hypothetical protein
MNFKRVIYFNPNNLLLEIEAKMGKSRGSGIQPSSNSFLGINNA